MYNRVVFPLIFLCSTQYKMATGAVVFTFETPNRYIEFFETVLQDGVHLVRLNPIEDGSFNDVTGKQDVHPAAGFVCHHHDCSPLLIHWCAAVPRIKGCGGGICGLARAGAHWQGRTAIHE